MSPEAVETLLKPILDSSESGLILLDSARRLLIWNAWMADAAGIEAEAALGRTIDDLFGVALTSRLSHAIDDALERRMSAVLSATLNKNLLPLHSSHVEHGKRSPIKQYIVVKPIECGSQRQCLLQVTDITNADRREQVLRRQARAMRTLADEHRSRGLHIQAILDNTAEGILSFNADGLVGTFNAATLRIFGYGPCDIAGRPISLLVPELSAARRAGGRHETIGRRADGTTFPLELSIAEMGQEGEMVYVAVAHDITSRKRAEAESHQQQGWLTTLINTLPDIVCLKDGKGRWLVANQVYCELLDLDGVNPIGLTTPEIASHCTTLKSFLWNGRHTDETAWSEGKACCFEAEVALANGETRVFDVLKTPLFNADGSRSGLVEIGRDITERKTAAARIQHIAQHDGLTELPNRVLFQERLRDALEQSRRSGNLVALMLLDLDKFKDINDTLGHHVGDLLLRNVSKRLKTCVRQTDTVSRFGGDEFAVLLTNISSADDASTVAESILSSIAEPQLLDDNEVVCTASLGITLFPEDGMDPEQLLKNADLALYRSKSDGRSRYHFYVAEMDEEVRRRKSIARDLRMALADEQLNLFYQPLVDLASGEIVGAEALVRWSHPTRGMIPPASFIPIAERNELIFRLGRWVLRRACSQMRLWEKEGLGARKVSVNLSPAQFRHTELLDTIKEVIADTGIEPHQLQLEITETIAMTNFEYSIQVLKELRRLGVTIAIDDFGTGYSSLNYLKHFPVDKLKIDKSFITDLSGHPENAAIVRAIISLGHGIGARVNVEGVETFEQLSFMRDHACDECQGYYFSAPLPANDYSDLLRYSKPWSVAAS
jgi:diguanylate cyclase (GGDEF)-like protein/PAS domain S-box-containing protein